MSAKLIFLAGSARKASLNKKLAKAAAIAAEKQGARVTYIDLADYAMPLYCEDFEAENGIPDAAKQLKELFADHDGFLLASPEYNSTFTPLIKNTFDWMTRPHLTDEPRLMAFNGKNCALMSATSGALGGIRGLTPVRLWLSNIGVHVNPSQFCLGAAHKTFDDNAALIGNHPLFNACITELVETAIR